MVLKKKKSPKHVASFKKERGRKGSIGQSERNGPDPQWLYFGPQDGAVEQIDFVLRGSSCCRGTKRKL